MLQWSGKLTTLVQIGNLKIRVFANDHNPPHFHIGTPDHAAAVSISSLEIIAGTMPNTDLKVALRWARENQEALESEWNRLNG